MDFKNIEKVTGNIPSSENLPIRYDLYYPTDQNGPLPVIIFLHGFKGFKDWGTFPAISQTLADAGFAVVAMNFSLNGIGENKLTFDRLDLFGRETFSQDIDDVGRIIQGIKNEQISIDETALDNNRIGILGHSRGGQTAVAATAEYDEVSCLVTWSAVANYNARWSEAMKNDWETKGVTEIKNGRTGQIMPLKINVYDDAREHADRVIALNRVGEVEAPSLFVHAKDDEAVPATNAEQLFETSAATEKDILLVPNTGHTFDGAHPFNDDVFPAPLQQVMDKTSKWFINHFKNGDT